MQFVGVNYSNSSDSKIFNYSLIFFLRLFFDYFDFLDWIWISCNYVPFMSLVSKNESEYGDGGFTSLVPIREAIKRGATEVDVIILETETQLEPINVGKNPFSLMVSIFSTLFDQVEKNDVTIGKLAAKNKNVKLNLYYTPIKLTTNSLIFNKEKMGSTGFCVNIRQGHRERIKLQF